MTSIPGMGAPITKQQATPEPAAPVGPLVTITDRAAERAKQLLVDRGHAEGMLRVFVVGGGCSGYQYGMAIADEADDDDRVVDTGGGVRVVVDTDSVAMIQGAEIDYIEDLMKSGFTIYNPNAVSSCACGSSFQTAANPGTPRPCA
jgi:iron-sulfur cluster assembly protein